MLSVRLSTVSYSQSSSPSDSACYSAEENAAITRALLELRRLRKQDSTYAVAVGSYQQRDANLKVILDRYESKRAFLGIGIRKQKRRLRAEILSVH